MTRVITAQQAAGMIHDGDVVVFAPDSLVGFPNEIVAAVRQRFLKEGHPADITTLRAAGMGTFAEDEFGEGAWCIPGMLKSVDFLLSGGLPYSGENASQRIRFRGYMFPMGPILQLFQAAARGMPGVLSKIGLGTFMGSPLRRRQV